MARYLEGDVVLCRFPYQEDPTKFKARPGLILRVEMQGTIPFFHTAKITSTTDIADNLIGKLIDCRAKQNKLLNLPQDSFINLERIARLPLIAIMRRIGTCPFINEIHNICIHNRIPF